MDRTPNNVTAIDKSSEGYRIMTEIMSKSKEDINFICDSGKFNTIIEGYCRIVFEDLGLSERLKGYDFYSLFDEVSAAQARKKAQ